MQLTPRRGVFYFFFMGLLKIFVTVLFLRITICFRAFIFYSRTCPMTIFSPPRSTLKPGCQLIVLFPPSLPVSAPLASRILEIAQLKHANITLVSLTDGFDSESPTRCKLISLAGMVNFYGMAVDIQVEHGADWVGQAKRILQAGDSVVCFEGHKVGFPRRSLDDVLIKKLKAPTQKLTGFEPIQNPYPALLSQLAAWSGSLLLIGGFLWAEMKVTDLPKDWAHTALLYVLVVVEVILVGIWNSLFP
jgi:hypothetical protein